MTSLKDKHSQAVSTLLDRITPEVDCTEATDFADAIAKLCGIEAVEFCQRAEPATFQPREPVIVFRKEVVIHEREPGVGCIQVIVDGKVIESYPGRDMVNAMELASQIAHATIGPPAV